MTIDFIKIKDKILSSKFLKGDVFIEETKSTVVKFENSKLISIDKAEKEGIGVRIIKDSRVGFSSSNDFTKVDEVFEKAIDVSKYGEELDITFPKQPSYVLPIKVYDTSLENVNERDIVEFGEEIIGTIKEINPNIEVNLNIEKSFIKKTIINSSGLDLTLSKSIWGIEIAGVYVNDDESLLWLYDSKYTTRYDIDFSSMVSYLQNIFVFSNKDRGSINSGKYTVIFAPNALQTLINILCISLNGENVYRGISPVRDSIGEKIFSEKFSLIDSPHLDWAINSQPFDDEGVITNYNEIISNGVLKSFVNDLRTAYLQGQVSTGNGFRTYSSLPKPSFSNIIVPKGDNNLREMISSIDKGLIVYNVLGGGQSNVNAGEFSVNVETGLVVENGKILGRVKDVMIFGNVFDLFKAVISVSKETKAEHNAILPYIMFGDVNVASKNA
ncbi:MAG: TldD/PmbA family protein [Brevinematia bacterium]